MRLFLKIKLILCTLCLVLFAGSPVYAVTIKIATVAPEGSQWMVDLKDAGKSIEQKTAGRVKLKLYGGGVMGNDKKVLRKIRIGQLQGGAFTATGLAERYRDIVLYGLPMAFQSQAEVDYVRQQMDPILRQGLEDAGFVNFGFAGGGFALLMGAEPITDLKELRGRKVWVPEGDTISYKAMEAMELSPVVLPLTDVLTGLQTGLIEYVATPPVGAIVLQWYTKVKYVTPVPFAYTLGVLAIDKRVFDQISAADQAVVREVLEGVYQVFEERGRKENIDAEEALKSNGLIFVDVDRSLIPQWRETAAASNRTMAEQGAFSSDLLDTFLDHVANFNGSDDADRSASISPE